jgi:palmitoyltransferase
LYLRVSNWIVLLVLSGVVGLTVGLFGAWHISLVLRNYTTIEYLEETRFKGDTRRYLTAGTPEGVFNIFDIGYRLNWEQVMDHEPLLWLIPIQPG